MEDFKVGGSAANETASRIWRGAVLSTKLVAADETVPHCCRGSGLTDISQRKAGLHVYTSPAWGLSVLSFTAAKRVVHPTTAR
jgi:hypothetical protein